MATKPRSPWVTAQLQTSLYHTSCGNFQCNLMLSALERVGGVSTNDPPVTHMTSAQDSQPSPKAGKPPPGLSLCSALAICCTKPEPPPSSSWDWLGAARCPAVQPVPSSTGQPHPSSVKPLDCHIRIPKASWALWPYS